MRASANLAPREPLRRKVSPSFSEHEKEVFTSYLRILDSGVEPSQKTFDTLWQALRSAVIKELRRRSAWTSPPSYLGVFGWESWQAWDPGPRHTGSALKELLTDCYTFVFLEQRPRLRAQMAVKPNVDGLVTLYLRNYLHDRRKHYDLLGFRIYESLRSAALQALEAGELWILRGDSRVVNATVLATSPDVDPSDVVGFETLTPIIKGWGYDLLPDLITAGGTRRRQVVDRLRRHLLRLEAESVGGFRFKDLADALKRDLRARLNNLGRVRTLLGEPETAAVLLGEGLATERRQLKSDKWTLRVAALAKNLAWARLDSGDFSGCIELARPALETLSQSGKLSRIAEAQSILGGCLAGLGQIQEAEALLVKGYRGLEKNRSEEGLETRLARERLLSVYKAWGRAKDAASILGLVSLPTDLSEDLSE